MEPNFPQSQTQAPTPPTQPIPEQKKSFPKWLVLVLGSILILFLIGGAFMLGKNQTVSQKPTSKTVQISTPAISPTSTPTSDSTANWKTYTNAKYKFSIKYPSNWHTREFPDTQNGAAFTSSSKPNDYQNETIDIMASQKPTDNVNSSLENLVKIPDVQGEQKLASIKQITTTSGLVGYQTTWQSQSVVGGSFVTQPSTYFEIPNDTNDVIVARLSNQENLQIYNQMISTFKFTNSQATQSFLQIPEYGVKFALSTDIKDAYYLPGTASKGYVYLKIHSLDSEPHCNDNSSLGVAALNRVAKDEIDQRTGKKFSDSGNGSIVGNYYYFMDSEQAVCSQNASNQTIETNALKAFGEASNTITAL